MVLVRPLTDFGVPRESARRERFEQVPGNSATNVQQAIQNLQGGARAQRSITSGGNLPIVATDVIISINAATDLTPTIPLAAPRVGVPLTIKNLPGSHLQTLQATNPDTFDGVTTYALTSGASVTLIPFNDGVNSGYMIT